MNATEAGCLPKQGDGGGIDVKCCNHAGGSFGGIGIGKPVFQFINVHFLPKSKARV